MYKQLPLKTIRQLQVQHFLMDYQNGQLAKREGLSIHEIGKWFRAPGGFSDHSHVFKLESRTLTTLDSCSFPSPEHLTELREFRENSVQSYLDLV